MSRNADRTQAVAASSLKVQTFAPSLMQNAMTRLAFILALIFTANWQEAETVDVEGRGPVHLMAFNCQDITRSSLISRVCYDTEGRRMLVQRHAVYRQYCDLPKGTFDAVLNAPSMGRFFNANIQDGRPGRERPPAATQIKAPSHQ